MLHEKEHPAETSVKFSHGYYDMQAAIQMFHRTLLTQNWHYIRPYFFVFIFHKDLMKIYFPKKIPHIFSVILVFIVC